MAINFRRCFLEIFHINHKFVINGKQGQGCFREVGDVKIP